MAKALFIPTFLLATGFLIDFSMLLKTLIRRPEMAIGLILALVMGKWICAILNGRIYSYSSIDTRLIFSVTLPQMAATLASAVVGYNTMNANKELDIEFVNAILVLVVASCIAGPILTEKWGKQLSNQIDQPESS